MQQLSCVKECMKIVKGSVNSGKDWRVKRARLKKKKKHCRQEKLISSYTFLGHWCQETTAAIHRDGNLGDSDIRANKMIAGQARTVSIGFPVSSCLLAGADSSLASVLRPSLPPNVSTSNLKAIAKTLTSASWWCLKKLETQDAEKLSHSAQTRGHLSCSGRSYQAAK